MANKPFQILALPGGGFLGLHAAVILAEIEERLGHPVGQHFDLVAGTSVGGIVALGIASECSASSIVSMFENAGPEIFRHRISRYGIFRARFDHLSLRKAVENVLGSNTILGDAKRNIVIPALNLSKGGPTVFKTPHHPKFSNDWRLLMADIAMATSAAPTLFPLVTIDDRIYSDGSFFANSPELVALHEAQVFFGKADQEIRMLTIGTTAATLSLGHSEGTNWGIRKWFKHQRILEFLMASQASVVREMVQHRLPKTYHVIDSDRGRYAADEVGLVVASDYAIKTLRSLGKEAVKAAWGKDGVLQFFEHTASAPIFFHGPNAKKETSQC